jgi:hypothetical protein
VNPEIDPIEKDRLELEIQEIQRSKEVISNHGLKSSACFLLELKLSDSFEVHGYMLTCPLQTGHNQQE